MENEAQKAQESFLDFEKEAEKISKNAFSRMGFGFAALLSVWYVFHLFTMAILETFWPFLLRENWVVLLVNDVSLYGIAFFVFWFVIRKMPALAPRRFSLVPKNIGASVLMAYGLLVAGNLIGKIVSVVFDLAAGTKTVSTVSSVVDGNGNFYIVFFLMAAVAPVMEELIFRRLMMNRLRRYGRWTAILVSSLLFACMHGNLIQVFYAFLLGLLLGYIYERSGKLRYTLLVHILINAYSTLLVYVTGNLSSLKGLPLREIFSFVLNSDAGTLLRIAVTVLMILGEYVMAAFGIAFLIKRRKCFWLPSAGKQHSFSETGFLSAVFTPGMLTAFAVTVVIFVIPYVIR